MFAVPGTPMTINGKSGAPTGQPGPATTTAVKVPIPVPAGRGVPGDQSTLYASTFARYLRISNTDSTNSLLVSFLDGNQVTIAKGANQEFAGNIPFFTVQASSSTVQWEAFCIVAA